MSEFHLVAVQKEQFTELKQLLGDSIKPNCKYCDKPINKENFGFISIDVTCCDDLICLAQSVVESDAVHAISETKQDGGETDGKKTN